MDQVQPSLKKSPNIQQSSGKMFMNFIKRYIAEINVQLANENAIIEHLLWSMYA